MYGKNIVIFHLKNIKIKIVNIKKQILTVETTNLKKLHHIYFQKLKIS